MSDTSLPDALLLLGTTCPNCPQALQALCDLVKQGRLGTLRVVNLEQHPEIAAEFGVRSVPWVRIGNFELPGLRTAAEYRQWAEQAHTSHGDTHQLRALLGSGEAINASRMVTRNPVLLATFLGLLADGGEELNVRLGIGVVMEELAGSALLAGAVDDLGALSQHSSPAMRADACHYLGLTAAASAKSWLKARLADEEPTVREIAEESLALLSGE